MAYDKENKQDVAMKVNSKEHINQNEFDIMREMTGIKGFPKVISQGIVKK